MWCRLRVKANMWCRLRVIANMWCRLRVKANIWCRLRVKANMWCKQRVKIANMRCRLRVKAACEEGRGSGTSHFCQHMQHAKWRYALTRAVSRLGLWQSMLKSDWRYWRYVRTCHQMMNTNNILLCHGTTTYIIIMFNSFREICVEIGEKRNTVYNKYRPMT